MAESLIEYASTKTWFPTSAGAAWPGVKELLVFALIVAAMFLRGASLPTRGELVEQRLPTCPGPSTPTRSRSRRRSCARSRSSCCRSTSALTNSLIGIVMALAGGHHGLRRQISVVQLALAGVAGFTVSHLAVDAGIGFRWRRSRASPPRVLLGLVTAVSALRVRGVALAVVTIAAAVAVFNFGFVNPTWGGGATGSPVPIRSSSASTSGRRPRSAASTGTCRAPCSAGWRLPPPSCSRSSSSPCAVASWAAHAGRPVQRARRGRGGDRRPQRQADRVRHQRAHRGRRGHAVRVQLRLGERRPLQRPTRAQPDRSPTPAASRWSRAPSSPGSSPRRGSCPTPSTSGSASPGTGSCSSAASSSSSR